MILVVGLIALPRSRRRQRREPGPLPAQPRTLVILPTYNERATIGAVLDGLTATGAELDILVVDDGSPDGTGEIVRERAEADPHIRLVERPRKSGLASAYAVGFGRATAEGYDLAVEMDSDLSHRPEKLPGLLEAAERHHLVIGSRYIPGGSVTNWSRARVALSKAGNLYARFCLGFDLYDATSGFRVYRREALEEITATPVTSDGYGFQIELVYRAWNLGLSVGDLLDKEYIAAWGDGNAIVVYGDFRLGQKGSFISAKCACNGSHRTSYVVKFFIRNSSRTLQSATSMHSNTTSRTFSCLWYSMQRRARCA
jgi:glycosyltransferase involved in cell wall biosynthesis